MDDTIKEKFKILCNSVFMLIKVQYPKIRTIIIQYNNGEIYVGSSETSYFSEIYYDRNLQPNAEAQQLYDLMSSGETYNLLKELFDIIMKHLSVINASKKTKIESYNIIYQSTQQKVNICRNCGSGGLNKLRLFTEF